MRRRTVLRLLAALPVAGLFVAYAGAEEVKGTVTAACPQGAKLKLKTDCDKDVTFDVVEKARDQVKALKAGDKVDVSYVKCSKSGNLAVTSVKKQ